MALWITLGVLAFAVGTMMSLQPSAKEKALGCLREQARKMGLNPKVVACPDWLINAQGEKGKGMVALYGVILSDAKLPKIEAQIINGKINVVNADNTVRHLLHGEVFNETQDGTVTEDNTVKIDALGLTMQANFVGLYWHETVPKGGKNTQQIIEEKLKKIKENLQTTAQKVQAKRNLS